MTKHLGYNGLKLIILCSITLSCSETKNQKEYFNDLGEISFDEQLDDENFKVCHEDVTFPFNYGGVGLIYTGEKTKLEDTIRNKFQDFQIDGQTGYITVRFIINCEGKSGRFRTTEMGLDLKPKKFNKDIVRQILEITKELDGWKAFEYNEKTWDYQQYLTFKFDNGLLKDIMP
ncbi:hypothetical protein [Maribacter sp. R86514]|uniref:hypothetical protein n=1 Tax=Maribacter sp. R86514 TaxID=3093854 RepID=UPI0037CC158F